MVSIINKDEFQNKKRILLKELQDSIFIYPTDTIYGIGCNALKESLVKKIRLIKQRKDLPFSIIAPNKIWIKEVCELTPQVEEWLEKLPGPYTLILKLKNKDLLPKNINLGLRTIGIRIPDHWFSKVVEELGFPIITTSANITGGDYMKSLDDLYPNIKKQVDLIIYDGEIHGKPSTLVRLDQGLPELKERK